MRISIKEVLLLALSCGYQGTLVGAQRFECCLDNPDDVITCRGPPRWRPLGCSLPGALVDDPIECEDSDTIWDSKYNRCEPRTRYRCCMDCNDCAGGLFDRGIGPDYCYGFEDHNYVQDIESGTCSELPPLSNLCKPFCPLTCTDDIWNTVLSRQDFVDAVAIQSCATVIYDNAFGFGGTADAEGACRSVATSSFPFYGPCTGTACDPDTCPQPNVEVVDDPHFKTWSGSFYDYMGACDLKLIHVDNFVVDQQNDNDIHHAAAALDIDIRTKTRYDYSFIESAVVKIGNETFEVGSFGDYFLNGVQGTRLPKHISGFPISHKQLNKKTHIFSIELGGDGAEGEAIHLRTFKDWVSVTLTKPSKIRYQNSYGMMGQFGTGKLLGRDGVTIIEDPNALADEWQIRDTEPMLFQSVKSPQYPDKCQMPSATSATSRRLGGGGEKQVISYEAAEKACVDAGAGNKEGCIRDVIAIGDLDLAHAGVF